MRLVSIFWTGTEFKVTHTASSRVYSHRVTHLTETIAHERYGHTMYWPKFVEAKGASCRVVYVD